MYVFVGAAGAEVDGVADGEFVVVGVAATAALATAIGSLLAVATGPVAKGAVGADVVDRGSCEFAASLAFDETTSHTATNTRPIARNPPAPSAIYSPVRACGGWVCPGATTAGIVAPVVVIIGNALPVVVMNDVGTHGRSRGRTGANGSSAHASSSTL